MIRAALSRFDVRQTARLRALPIGRAGRLLLSVTAHSGDSLVLIPALALLWWREGFARQGVAVALAVAALVSIVLSTLVKYAVRRKRPAGEWGAMYRRTDPHSFPSGHAARTAALTVVLLARGLVWPGLAAAVWTLGVGFARIVLGVHYLLDVLAGYLLGLALGAAVAVWAQHGWPW